MSTNAYRDPPGTPPLLVAFAGKVHALDPATGAVLWETSIASGDLRLASEGEVLYAVAAGVVVALEITTGRVLWKASRKFFGAASMVVRNGTVFVAGNGYVECVRDGAHVWDNPLRGKGLGNVSLGFPGAFMQADRNT